MDLQKVKIGDPITADFINTVVEMTRREVTGPGVVASASGWHIRPVTSRGGANARWVVIRPPLAAGDVKVTAELAVRHPNYGIAGPDQGRWIAESEHPDFVGPPSVELSPVWPHRLGAHYLEYMWDGATVRYETQIMECRYMVDDWFIHPDPPFIVRRRPHTDVKTPCTPQEQLP